MSRPMADTTKRRPVASSQMSSKPAPCSLVLDDGKTVGAAARDLDSDRGGAA